MVPGEPKLPFDVEFQERLLRMLVEDDGVCHFLDPHLKPEYFDHEALGWVLRTCQQHRATYGGYPAMATLRQYAGRLDPSVRQLHGAVLERIAQSSSVDAAWIRDATLDFVKRQIFVRAFGESRTHYNAGRVDVAYDVMMRRLEELFAVRWEPVDRGWYFDELPARQNRRMNSHPWEASMTTGLAWLDAIMGGGPKPGELLIWIGYAKTGKSSMLIQHGAAAALSRRRTLHFVLEGSRQQVEARYDAHFLDELYGTVKSGDVDAEKYSATWRLFQELRGCLVVRGFTERWDYSVMDLDQEIRELERDHGWRAEHLVVDYVDLLGGRSKSYSNETEKQRAACRDLKSLANRGYVVTTASQARRPDKGSEDRAHWLYSREIADCYDKVRVADMIGSVNATQLERANRMLRLMVELYRDAEAGYRTLVWCDFGRMKIEERPGLVSPSMPDLAVAPVLERGRG